MFVPVADKQVDKVEGEGEEDYTLYRLTFLMFVPVADEHVDKVEGEEEEDYTLYRLTFLLFVPVADEQVDEVEGEGEEDGEEAAPGYEEDEVGDEDGGDGVTDPSPYYPVADQQAGEQEEEVLHLLVRASTNQLFSHAKILFKNENRGPQQCY